MGDLPNLANLDYVERINRAIDHVMHNLPEPLRLDGLPVGLEIDGPAGSDANLLAIAAAIEDLLPAAPVAPTSRWHT